ncbi:GumC family protein [Microbulbifer hainanensis]|uniref:GumC family protein n=1 Tax=Microbulbifer hainanensis TaxID=2735675 RepID=UPI001865FD9E|nr:polysaccharide biosynthesis tyrosine autokinase [Microbulbifer hainanensis]
MSNNTHFDSDEAADEQGPDLRKYLQIVLARKWLIVGLTAAITALVAIIVLDMSSRYKATATLMFELDSANLVSVEKLYDVGSQQRDYILTQTELLQSRELAERVIRKLDLLDNPEFEGQLQSESFDPLGFLSFSDREASAGGHVDRTRMDKVVTLFLKRLTIEPKRYTHLVDITFEAHSPSLAAQVANTVVAEYIASQEEAKSQFTNRASSWLQERLETLRGKLEQSEADLHAFREAEDLVDVSGVNSLAEQELNEMTAQLQDMRRQLKQISSVYEQMHDLEGNELALANLPEVLSNPMIQEIKRNEAEASRNVAELSRRYGPKHPDMIAANNKLAMVREQLRTEVRNLSAAIESQYVTALTRVSAQELDVKRAKENYQEVSRKKFRYDELLRETEVNRKLFNTFLTRVNETRETTGFETAPARLADPAVAPERPASPNRKLAVAAAFAIALMFSVALTFVLDFLHEGVRSPEDVEMYLHQRLMGVLPDVSKASGERLPLRTFYDPEQFTFSESVRTLRTGVVLSRPSETGRVIAVASSVPGEGKTTVAQSLAFALAQVEKVLLIDADLRKPVIGMDFAVPEGHPGLAELVEGSSAIDECIFRDEKSGVHLVPAGVQCEDPQKQLVSPQFGEMIKVLARSYDRIIIDTPPVQAVSDALIIARQANSILYVVKYDDTNKRLVSKGIDRFRQVGAEIDGVVLNHVDTSRNSAYADEYQGYGYGREERSRKAASAEPAGAELQKLDSEKAV